MNVRIKRFKELIGYAVQLLKEEGFTVMFSRALAFFKRRLFHKKDKYLPSAETLKHQRAENSDDFPLISICTPLYNTPKQYLKEFINSVITQSCAKWELCLADASDEEHAYVKQIVESYSDPRIRYKKIENIGIASNTNAAIEMAAGTYIGLADHDDILAPHAVYVMAKAILQYNDVFLYSDEALFSKSIRKAGPAHFKPDFSYEYFLSCNYLCHFTVFQKALFEAVGGERDEMNGSQDYDLFLRMLASGATPRHIPQVLYYWRVHENSTSGGNGAKPYVTEAGINALKQYLQAKNAEGTVVPGIFEGTYKVTYTIPQQDCVSIIIPNKDHIDDLDQCLRSIYEKTTYPNFEVLIVENNSEKAQTFEYYKDIQARYAGCKVLYYKGGFNFSAINNFGRQSAKGNYLLLLNNDVEIINPEWLTEMVSCLQPQECGACGAMLYYQDNTVQHAGIITGLGGYAGHSHKYHKRGKSGYMFRMACIQNFSAVTAACILVKAHVYDEMHGLDEEFTVAFNDVDFCLRIRDAGYRIVWTPYAELYHYESKSRGLDEKDAKKKARFDGERKRLYSKHTREGILHDPFYNPGLTLDREDFSESDDLRHLK